MRYRTASYLDTGSQPITCSLGTTTGAISQGAKAPKGAEARTQGPRKSLPPAPVKSAITCASKSTNTGVIRDTNRADFVWEVYPDLTPPPEYVPRIRTYVMSAFHHRLFQPLQIGFYPFVR